jgi:hypothetical protein
MNDSYAKLIAEWPNELKTLALENRLAYLHEKARLFILLGAEKYRKMDFFSQPDESFKEEEIEIIRQGCHQILEGKGVTAENPLENIGVSGFYDLMQLFHFEPVQRKSKPISINGSKGILDQITFEHLIEESKVTYFNFCFYDLDENEKQYL